MQSDTSEIAQFRYNQALQEEAALRGLYGPRVAANHQMINANMERGAERLLKLIDEGKYAEVTALMETQNWGFHKESLSLMPS